MPGASQDPNAATHANPSVTGNTAENPQDDYAEFLKFIEENEGQFEETSSEPDSDDSD